MLDTIHLSGFRSLLDVTVPLTPRTAILGRNGAGKTSVLEALAMLSVTTSWRTTHDKEVVNFDTPFARVVSGDHELVIQREPYMKRIRVDGRSMRAREVLGMLPSVLFQPDDLQLLLGAPSVRRHYLDRVLCQASPAYTAAVAQLTPVLRQRNRLLKQIQERKADRGELQFWNEQLIGCIEVIRPQRERLVRKLGERTPIVFSEFVAGDWQVSLEYSASPSPEVISGDLRDFFASRESREIAAGTSLYGPQRDDVLIAWNNHPVAASMSRGQLRSLALALKFAEVEILHEITGVQPILLLDDILSELDHDRQITVLERLGEVQAILTSTELPSGLPAGVLDVVTL